MRRPADKARKGGAPTGRTGPGVFRPKRNDERREASRSSRDASPVESGAGREHRGDPGAEGTGGGVTRPPSLLARASGAGREHRGDPGAEGTGGGATRPPSLLARARRPRSGRDGGRGYPTTIPSGSGFRSGARAPRRPRSGRDGGRGYPTPIPSGSGIPRDFVHRLPSCQDAATSSSSSSMSKFAQTPITSS